MANKGLQQTIRTSLVGEPAPPAIIVYSRLAAEAQRSTDTAKGARALPIGHGQLGSGAQVWRDEEEAELNIEIAGVARAI